MVRQVMFVQGGGEGTYDVRDISWSTARRTLGSRNDTPKLRLTDEGHPKYRVCKAAVLAAVAGLDDGAILAGHSMGGTILINAVAKARSVRKLAGIFLISVPFVGTGGWPSDESITSVSLGHGLPANMPVDLCHVSKNDTAPVAHVGLS